jgi:N-acetylmuramoyl-L-alanine amidase
MTDVQRPRLVLLALAVVSTVGSATAGPMSALEEAPRPLAGIVIALDPGHNGGNATHGSIVRRKVFIGNGRKACNTTGTRTRSGYAEHRFAFSVARRVQAALEGLGATVYLTRRTDTGVGPCVTARGRFGRKVDAQLLVSIHADGSSSSHRGFVVLRPGRVPGYTDDIVTASRTLAKAMRRGLRAGGLPIANYYARDGIRKRTDLGTLNLSDVPAVMVELGNMKNASDARRMTTKAGRARYAAGLVTGILSFLGR